MNSLDWLRLGGLIARKWPEIDFAEVRIEKVDQAIHVYRIPILDGDCNIEFKGNDIPDKQQLGYEDIHLQKAIIEGHSVRVGYGPKTKSLLVGMTRSLDVYDSFREQRLAIDRRGNEHGPSRLRHCR